jgi:hypothetical protein
MATAGPSHTDTGPIDNTKPTSGSQMSTSTARPFTVDCLRSIVGSVAGSRAQVRYFRVTRIALADDTWLDFEVDWRPNFLELPYVGVDLLRFRP